jgi:hypothetical protein
VSPRERDRRPGEQAELGEESRRRRRGGGGGEETAGGGVREEEGRRKVVGPCPNMWGPLPHHRNPPSKPTRD